MTDTAQPPLTTALADLRIDGPRLVERLETLARLGGIDLAGRPVPADVVPAGSSRLAATAADGRGRDLVTGWMRALGLQVRIDEVGNVTGVRPAGDGSIAEVVSSAEYLAGMARELDALVAGFRTDADASAGRAVAKPTLRRVA